MSKGHSTANTLGHLFALHVTATDEQDRAQVEKLAEAVQQITGDNIELAYVDQGYTGESASQAAEKHGVQLEAVKHTQAKRGFVLLPPLGGGTKLCLGGPLPQADGRPDRHDFPVSWRGRPA